METLTLTTTCLSCDGSGEIETGCVETETGYPVTASCINCHGEGDIPLTADETCETCGCDLREEGTVGQCLECAIRADETCSQCAGDLQGADTGNWRPPIML